MTNCETSKRDDLADVPLAQSKCGVPKKRIFIYGINYAPEPTGVGRYTGELGTYLAKQGLDVNVVTAVPHYPGWAVREGYRNWFSTQSLAGIQVTRCPLFLRSEMGGFWRLMAPLTFALSSAPVAIWHIITKRPDTVLCVEPTLFSAPAALLAAKLVGAKTVLHVQDLEIDAAFAVGHLQNRLLQIIARTYERLILRRFDAVVTISGRMSEKLTDKGVSKDKLIVVRNWVDLGKIIPLGRPSAYRDELGINRGAFVVLYAGNIGEKQALNVLLDVAVFLKEKLELFFVIVGDGPSKQDLLGKYAHLPNVIFLPLQREENLCELLNLADVHVLPQSSNMADLVLPSKLGGMLASGKRCIVMADSGTELYEFLLNAVVLVSPGKVSELAAAIVNMIEKCDPTDGQLTARLTIAEKLSARLALARLHKVIIPPE